MTTSLSELVERLTLAEKVSLVSGFDFWHTVPLPSIGLKKMRFSDGPSGVRGPSFDERKPSLSLPSASALSATWDLDLARLYGEVSASEAIEKDVDVVLGPTINLHRSPLGGRHFEAYSEDPVLTGRLASAYVLGVQAMGIGACPKHYVANDFESERHTVDVIVDDVTLSELYLKPFEIAIHESNPWMIMSAYNAVNGHTMSASPLLTTPLRSEWGYEGVVVSDWTAVRSVESAASDQDLAMPGPKTPWNERLQEAIESGLISERTLDQKVIRILALAEKVGALDNQNRAKSPLPKADREEIAIRVAEQGSVLLKNNGILPLSEDSSIGVIGDSALRSRFQGGGSAQVMTPPVEPPLEAIRKKSLHEVKYATGAEVLQGVSPYFESQIRNPKTGSAGCRVEFQDENQVALVTEDRLGTFLIFDEKIDPDPSLAVIEFDLDLAGYAHEDYVMGVATCNEYQLFIDGVLAGHRREYRSYSDLAEAILQPETDSIRFDLNGRSSLSVRLEVIEPGIKELFGNFSVMIGEAAREDDPEQLIRQAVRVATNVDVPIVVVGTNSSVESEGFDRQSISLPGYQDALVEAIAEVNPNTVVVVNSGAPVDMPWRNQVGAIVVSWFGGQFMGPAIANILFGEAEPAGRLPTSWVMSDELAPVSTTPAEGKMIYSEGVDIGYRRLLQEQVKADFPIGFGLGWGDWSLLEANLQKNSTASYQISATLANESEILSRGFVMVFATFTEKNQSRRIERIVGWGRTESVSGKTSLTIEIAIDALGFSPSDQVVFRVAMDANDPGIQLTHEA